MGVLVTTEGDIMDFVPMFGDEFNLTEMQEAVGGYIQILFGDFTIEDKVYPMCVINEEGKLSGLPHNPEATRICNGFIFAGDWIAGDALFAEEGEIT